MNRKTAPVLIIALVCGLGAMVASSRMLARGESAPAPETQQILLAARDLAVEEVLKPDMIRLETVPKSAIPPGAFTSFRDMADRWVQVKVFEGEPIVDRKLAPKGTPTGLIARIPRGRRAFAINVNEQSGVSGFILPDHRVDVFQVQTRPDGSMGRAVPVLQDVLVLASGTNIQTPTDRSVQARTVTVAVTPEEASILTVAQSRGQLSLALRALNDHDMAEIAEPEPPAPAVPQVAMTPPSPPPAPPSPPVEEKPAKTELASLVREEEPMPRHVTIYRGPGKPPERVRVDQPPGDEESGGLGGFPSAADLASAPGPGNPARPGARNAGTPGAMNPGMSGLGNPNPAGMMPQWTPDLSNQGAAGLMPQGLPPGLPDIIRQALPGLIRQGMPGQAPPQ